MFCFYDVTDGSAEILRHFRCAASADQARGGFWEELGQAERRSAGGGVLSGGGIQRSR